MAAEIIYKWFKNLGQKLPSLVTVFIDSVIKKLATLGTKSFGNLKVGAWNEGVQKKVKILVTHWPGVQLGVFECKLFSFLPTKSKQTFSHCGFTAQKRGLYPSSHQDQWDQPEEA